MVERQRGDAGANSRAIRAKDAPERGAGITRKQRAAAARARIQSGNSVQPHVRGKSSGLRSPSRRPDRILKEVADRICSADRRQFGLLLELLCAAVDLRYESVRKTDGDRAHRFVFPRPCHNSASSALLVQVSSTLDVACVFVYKNTPVADYTEPHQP